MKTGLGGVFPQFGFSFVFWVLFYFLTLFPKGFRDVYTYNRDFLTRIKDLRHNESRDGRERKGGPVGLSDLLFR